MSRKKLLTILSSEWLASPGDYDQLLVRFSVIDSADLLEVGQELSAAEYRTVIRVTRSLLAVWSTKDPRLGERSNLENVVLDYARRHIRESIETGKQFPVDQELLLGTSTDYTPPDPAEISVVFGQPEEVEVERRIGFLP